MDQPINHDGSNWWILAATPKDLEASMIFKLGGARVVRNVNQPYPITLPNGTKTLAAPGTQIVLTENNMASYFVTNDVTEVWPGITAGRFSEVGFDSSGNLAAVDVILNNPYGIPEHSRVVFSTTPHVSTDAPRIDSIRIYNEQPMYLAKFNAFVTGDIKYASDGVSIKWATLAADLKIGAEFVAGKGTQVLDLRLSHSNLGRLECDRFKLAHDLEFAGSQYSRGDTLDVKWVDGHPKVLRVFPRSENAN